MKKKQARHGRKRKVTELSARELSGVAGGHFDPVGAIERASHKALKKLEGAGAAALKAAAHQPVPLAAVELAGGAGAFFVPIPGAQAIGAAMMYAGTSALVESSFGHGNADHTPSDTDPSHLGSSARAQRK